MQGEDDSGAASPMPLSVTSASPTQSPTLGKRDKRRSYFRRLRRADGSAPSSSPLSRRKPQLRRPGSSVPSSPEPRRSQSSTAMSSMLTPDAVNESDSPHVDETRTSKVFPGIPVRSEGVLGGRKLARPAAAAGTLVAGEHIGSVMVGVRNNDPLASHLNLCRLKSSHGLVLGAGLANNVHVQRIDLSDSTLFRVEDRAILVSSLTGLPSLTSLSFDRVKGLTDDVVVELCAGFQLHTALARLSFVNCNLTSAIQEAVRALCIASFSLTHVDVEQDESFPLHPMFTLRSAQGERTVSAPLFLAQNRILSTAIHKGGNTADVTGRLTEHLPACLPALTHLTSLNVSMNRLRHLDPALLQLRALSRLNVSDNHLVTLPEGIRNLTQLQALDVSHNRLEALPAGIGNLANLTDLDVCCNRVKVLPISIGLLRSVQRVRFRASKGVGSENPFFARLPKKYQQKGSNDEAVLQWCQRRLATKVGCRRVKLLFLGEPSANDFVCSLLEQMAQLHVTPPDPIRDPADCFDPQCSGSTSFVIPPSRMGAHGAVRFDALALTTKQDMAPLYAGRRSIIVACFRVGASGRSTTELLWRSLVLASQVTDAPVFVLGLASDGAQFSRSSSALMETQAAVSKLRARFPCIKDALFVNATDAKVCRSFSSRLFNLSSQMPWLEAQVPLGVMALEEQLASLRASLHTPVCSTAQLRVLLEACGLSDPAEQHAGVTLLTDLALVHIASSEPWPKCEPAHVLLDEAWVCSRVLELRDTHVDDEDPTGAQASPAADEVAAADAPHDDVHALQPVSKLRLCWDQHGGDGSDASTVARSLERGDQGDGGNTVDGTCAASPCMSADGAGPKDEAHVASHAILTLLEHRGLAFRVPSQCVVFLPYLLPSKRPKLRFVWPKKDQTRLQLSRHLILDEPSFLFRILPRLVVRALLGGWELVSAWRLGMVMQHGAETLHVESLVSTNTLKVHVRAPGTSRRLTDLLAGLNTLLHDWLQAKVRVEVPCIHCMREASYDPYKFSLSQLQDAAAAGRSVVWCRSVNPILLPSIAPDITMKDLAVSTIDYADIRMGPQVGTGGYAKVYRAHLDGHLVAVKKLIIGEEAVASQDDRVKAFEEFRREVWLMSGLVHENLVVLKGVCMEPLCILMEFMNFGDLHQFIHSWEIHDGDGNSRDDACDEPPLFAWDLIVKLALDIALGMRFLHNITPPIIHRDLKSPNILLRLASPSEAKASLSACAEEDVSTTVMQIVDSLIDNAVHDTAVDGAACESDDVAQPVDGGNEDSDGCSNEDVCAGDDHEDDEEDRDGGVDEVSAVDVPIDDASTPPLDSCIPSPDTLVAKVSDFGLSRDMGLAPGLKGTEVDNPVWTAPEVIRGERYSEKVDVYSFGIILWELLTRRSPFKHHQFFTQMEEGIVSGERPDIPANCIPEYRALVTACWADEASNRPSFGGIVTQLSDMVTTYGYNVALPSDGAEEGMPAPRAAPASPPMLRRATMESSAPVKIVADNPEANAATVQCPYAFRTSLGTLHEYSVQCIERVGAHIWTACSHGGLYVWDIASGALAHTTAFVDEQQELKSGRHTKAVFAILPFKGSVWTASADHSIRVWSRELLMLKELRGHKDTVVFLDNADDGTVVSGSSDGQVRFWSRLTHRCEYVHKSGQPIICMRKARRAGFYWAASGKDLVYMAPRRNLLWSFHAHDSLIHDMCVVGNELWTCSADKTVRVWTVMGDAVGAEDAGVAASVSMGGPSSGPSVVKAAAAADPDAAPVVRRVATLEGHASRVMCLATDGDLVFSGGWDTQILVWHVQTHAFVTKLPSKHVDAVSALRVMQSGGARYLLSGSSDRSVAIWTHKDNTAAAAVTNQASPPPVPTEAASHPHPSPAGNPLCASTPNIPFLKARGDAQGVSAGSPMRGLQQAVDGDDDVVVSSSSPPTSWAPPPSEWVRNSPAIGSWLSVDEDDDLGVEPTNSGAKPLSAIASMSRDSMERVSFIRARFGTHRSPTPPTKSPHDGLRSTQLSVTQSQPTIAQLDARHVPPSEPAQPLKPSLQPSLALFLEGTFGEEEEDDDDDVDDEGGYGGGGLQSVRGVAGSPDVRKRSRRPLLLDGRSAAASPPLRKLRTKAALMKARRGRNDLKTVNEQRKDPRRRSMDEEEWDSVLSTWANSEAPVVASDDASGKRDE